MAAFAALVGVRVPGSSVFGLPLVVEDTVEGLEAVVSWMMLECSWWRLRCEQAAARYALGHEAYLVEVGLLFQSRVDSGARLPDSGQIASGLLVGCGLCSEVGPFTRAQAGAHLCVEPPLLPGCALHRVAVVFPDVCAVPRRSRAEAQRLCALRTHVVGLFKEHRALLALDDELWTLVSALADAHFCTGFERCLLGSIGPRLWIHGFRSAWRCRRGCPAGPDEWATHVCPRLSGFHGCVVSSDDYSWDVTGLTLRKWSY